MELNTGALSFEAEDFTIPGVAGLDLIVKRQYNSTAAKEHEFTYQANRATAYWFAINVIANPSDVRLIGGPFANQNVRHDHAQNWLDYFDRDFFKATSITERNDYQYKTALRDNNQYLQDHKLGHGWMFSFPSIDAIPDSFERSPRIAYHDYLNLGDGNRYIINGGRVMEYDQTTKKLKPRVLQDFTFSSSTGSISYPDGTSGAYNYIVSFKDGKRFYLNKRNIVAIQDRHGNQIRFRFMDSGIDIWDTLNRAVTLRKYDVASASTYKLRWTLPDGRTMNYHVVNNELATVEDFVGLQTNHHYAVLPAGCRKFFDYSGDTGVSTNVHLLTAVENPTAAATIYEWTQVREQVSANADGGNRYEDIYVIAYRFDVEAVLGELYERNHHSYGYSIAAEAQPKEGDDRHNEYNFTFYKTLTKVFDNTRGRDVFHTFDSMGRRTAEQGINRSTGGTLYNKSFAYNANRLLTGETNVIRGTSASRTETRGWNYDNYGNQLSATDPMGNTQEYTYYTANYCIPQSKTYYRGPSQVCRIQETFELAAGGKNIGAHKLTEDGVLKQHTTYTYNGNGTRQSIIENQPGGAALRTTQLIYQDGVFVKQGTINGLAQKETTFNILGQKTQEKDPNGNITTYHRDNIGRLTKVVHPDGTYKEYQYVVDYNRALNAVYVRDENGNRTYQDFTPLGKEQDTVDLTTGALIIRRLYDLSNRLNVELTLTVNQDAIRTWRQINYDYLDRPLQDFVENSADNVAELTQYTYDDAYEGQYAKATKYQRGTIGISPDIVTTTYTDALGNTVKTGRFIGGVERLDVHTYDNMGNKLTTLTAFDASRNISYSGKWDYDYAGRVVREYQARPAGGAEVYTTNTYDALGNLISSTDFKGVEAKKTHDILGRVIKEETLMEAGHYAAIHHEYDLNGNEVLTRVQCNKPGEAVAYKRTRFVYDSRNRVTDTIQYHTDNDSSYARAKSVYDGVGNVLESYSGMTSDSTVGASKVSYTYNQFQKVLTVTDALGRIERYTYDVFGRLTSKLDREGVTIRYEYDDMNRIVAKLGYQDNVLIAVTQHSYSPLHNIYQSSTPSVQETNEYDEAGRLIYVSDTDGISKRMAYDTGDNRTQLIVYDEGVEIMRMNYTYDHMNRMKTVSKGGALLATYEYDNNGNRVSLANVNGAVTTYGYNPCNMITSLINKKPNGTVISQYDYTYYLDGNQASKSEPGKTTTYIYDRLGRLTDERVSDGSSWRYTFDAFGNRKTLTFSGSGAYTVTYHYDLCNKLLSEVRTGAGAETKTYTYDNNGNQATCTGASGTEYKWYDAFDQLVEVYSNTVHVVYGYRPNGNRQFKSSVSEEVLHVWDGGSIVVDYTFASPITLFMRGTGLIAQESEGVRQYYLHNGHGDVVQLVDGSGNVAVSYGYDAFGNQLPANTGDRNPFRYCGEYFDQESGTYYLRARYYNPRTGRFGAEDVAKDGINWYTYCGNNPLSFIDPLGLEKIAVSGGVYKKSKQDDGEYYYEFIDSAIAQIEEWLKEKDDESIKWLVADYGWSAQDMEMIKNHFHKNNRVSVSFVSSSDQIGRYLNNKTFKKAKISNQARLDDPITSFSLFSHGLSSDDGTIPLAFNYAGGHTSDAGGKLTITGDFIGKINSNAFSNDAVSYFYSCNTGTSGNTSFAQNWANMTGGTTYAFKGQSDYTWVASQQMADKISRRMNGNHHFGGLVSLPVAASNAEMLTFNPFA